MSSIVEKAKSKLVELIKKVIKDSFTGINGVDYDPARVIGYGMVVLGSILFLVLAIYDTVKLGKFDYTGYATGLGSIGISLTAAAAGVWLKKDTEPTHVDPLPPPATTVEEKKD